MQKIRVATCQMNALLKKIDHNLDVHRRIIREAAEAGCSLIVFPEISVTGHAGTPEAHTGCEEAGSGPIYSALHKTAREHDVFVAYGFCEKAAGTVYNSHALVGPDGLIGVQRKCVASGDEYFYFRMGRSFHVFDIGICRIGAVICYDSAFSEHWRILALKGAEVVMHPSAGRGGGFARKVPESEQLERLEKNLAGFPGSTATYAAENGIFVIRCNQIGFNGHSTHSGGACIVGPQGELLAMSEASLEDLWISAELDPEALAAARSRKNFTLKNRRPELYGEISEMI